MKRLLFSLLALIFFFCGGEKKNHNPEITKSEIQEHINFLASDSLKGRFAGSPEAEVALNYIINYFKDDGLKPLFNNSYYQSFNFISGVLPGSNNKFELDINKARIIPSLNKDYSLLSFSDNTSFKGELVFAGYGISAKDLNYDDYENLNVKGKIVIVMRNNPDMSNPHSEFDKYSSLRYKANLAQDKGASGIIFCNGYIPKIEEDILSELKYDGAPGIKDFNAIHLKRSYIERIFKNENLSFSDIQQKIDSTHKPNSFIIKYSKIKITTELKQITKVGKNAGAVIIGSDPMLKNEYIVIGAHYDHLGFGETGSLYRGPEKLIHNGADDNASGTAGVIELAEKFASLKNELKRSIIFLAFSGEELGLLGSDYFVKHSPVPIEKIKAMINLDMIGRLNSDKSLIVYGTGTSSIWKNLLNKYNDEYKFKLTLNDEGYGPSDQSSFYAKKIPVLFFFTGTHSDYHRPSDDADKINLQGEENILKYVFSIADQIEIQNYNIDYISIAQKNNGNARTFKVYVGTIPDFSEQKEGFKINGVNEGSPAQKGGLKAGDIIVSFGGKKISNIYDYSYALGEFSPGDVVDVIILRQGKELKFKIELGAK